jgi:hypothetical protein
MDQKHLVDLEDPTHPVVPMVLVVHLMVLLDLLHPAVLEDQQNQLFLWHLMDLEDPEDLVVHQKDQ